MRSFHFPHLPLAVVLLGLLACSPAPQNQTPNSTPNSTPNQTPISTSTSTPNDPAHAAGSPAAVDARRLLDADSEPGQWLTTGRTYSEQHYSPLAQLTAATVGNLGLAWYADFDTSRGQESTPLVVDDVIYVTTAWSKLFAYDARTGASLWKYDPQVPGEWGVRACCDVVNRGAAVWNGKVFVGTIDGRLVAVDAASGEVVWETDTLISHDLSYSITGAPRVVKGRVLIGNGGAEYGVRGYVSAYDAENGDLVWRFFTVPGNPALGFENDTLAMAAETWQGEWWALGGGGTVWDSMAYDPELDLLYIGTGNGSPWNQSIRSPGGGDNLFLSSIVALDPDDGSYVWHYQTTPGESWDYTATQPIVLADLELNGETRRVLMQAPKNGFFYVLDAATGAFISAQKFAAVNWASGIDPQSGRPIENPNARYGVTGRAYAVQPSSAGAHNWHPMAYHPGTGLVYLSAANNSLVYAADKNFNPNPLSSNLGIDIGAGLAELGPNATAQLPSGSSLLAWNPVSQREVWRVDAAAGGILATAGGLLFKGNADRFSAYAADSGEELWSLPTHTGVVAAPVSYELDGEQYIAVVAGRSTGNYYAPSYSRLLVFKAGGTAQLPPALEYSAPPLDPPPATAPAAVVAQGEGLYQQNCIICHGDPGTAGGLFRRGLFPDLLLSPALNSAELFNAVVLDGVRSGNGMVSFASVMDAEDAGAIRAYLIERAHVRLGKQP
ncbi:MAG: PQQ-dependent dehydrogenase, methanol/ethanol family [Pseudomonadales bacterium]|nr:PQQ-dependent dehydrogenase, methanol/ethanol family [Pseudomonadales bacterium]